MITFQRMHENQYKKYLKFDEGSRTQNRTTINPTETPAGRSAPVIKSTF